MFISENHYNQEYQTNEIHAADAPTQAWPVVNHTKASSIACRSSQQLFSPLFRRFFAAVFDAIKDYYGIYSLLGNLFFLYSDPLYCPVLALQFKHQICVRTLDEICSRLLSAQFCFQLCGFTPGRTVTGRAEEHLDSLRLQIPLLFSYFDRRIPVVRIY